jgi:hypothetical protein
MTQCDAEIRKAFGKDLSKEELSALIKELQERQKFLSASENIIDQNAAAMKAAEQIGETLKAEAIIKKRNTMLGFIKLYRSANFIDQNYHLNVQEGLETLLVGSNRMVQGARASVDQEQRQLVAHYFSGVVTDLLRSDVLDVVTSGKFDRELAAAMFDVGDLDAHTLASKHQKEVLAAAQILKKWGDYSRIEANREGAWIGNLKNYIVKQSHDMLKIRSSGSKEWVQYIKERLDILKTFQKTDITDAEIDEYLYNLYERLSTGVHIKNKVGIEDVMGVGLEHGIDSSQFKQSVATAKDLGEAFPGVSNVGKRLSQSRQLHFKNSDAWFEYNERFGVANVRQAYFSSLENLARKTGLMRVLSTTPEAFVDTLKKREILRLQEMRTDRARAEVIKITERSHILENYMAAVDGSMNIPGVEMAARISAGLRGIATLSKLGGMVMSQLSDMAVFATSMRHHGNSFLGGLSKAMVGFGNNLKQKEKRDLLGSLGVISEGLRNSIAMDVNGLGVEYSSSNKWYSMANLTRHFMRLNLSNWWTDKMRASAALGLSNNLGVKRSKPFGGLEKDLQRTLGIYGIDSFLWDKIRKTDTKMMDGNDYIVPENVLKLSDKDSADISNYLKSRNGVAPLKDGREHLADMLRNYYVDNVGFAVLDPDAKTRAITFQGTRPGTFAGELLRFMWQFKSFSVAYLQKAVGRELFSRGYMGDSALKAMMNGRGEMQGLATLIVASTALGYMSMILKDLSKGKTPRNILDPEQSYKVFLAAMVQGGGAGIYGDFLFGEKNRVGGGTGETILGPVISQAAAGVDLYQAWRSGEDPKARTFQYALNNTPFLNLFYTRMALNYLILYRIQESLNPGSLARMERRVKKENNQTYILRPSNYFGK